MTKRKPQIEKSNSAEADLRAALGRLRRGQPLHPDHVKLKAEGRLKISVASVAREAGRSRTLIGTGECVYLALRNEVLAAAQAQVPLQGEKVANLTAQDTIKGLREENNLLRQERAALATRVQEAVNVARSLEKKLVAATREADRVRTRQSNPDKLVGRTLAGANVVALHGGD